MVLLFKVSSKLLFFLCTYSCSHCAVRLCLCFLFFAWIFFPQSKFLKISILTIKSCGCWITSWNEKGCRYWFSGHWNFAWIRYIFEKTCLILNFLIAYWWNIAIVTMRWLRNSGTNFFASQQWLCHVECAIGGMMTCTKVQKRIFLFLLLAIQTGRNFNLIIRRVELPWFTQVSLKPCSCFWKSK